MKFSAKGMNNSRVSAMPPFNQLRLAIVLSHPVQYYSPWFRFLAANGFAGLRVFYLWDGGITERLDEGFAVPVKWDVPLLDGYEHEFVPNCSARPGSASIRGLDNPDLSGRLNAFAPQAILVFGYNYLTHYRLLFSGSGPAVPLLFRGDSHRLFPARGWKARLKNEAIRRIFRKFSAFLHVGAANRDYFLHHGVSPEQLFFCPHCVDNDRFSSDSGNTAESAREWKRDLNIPAQHRVIVFAGKFEEKKRPRDLLEAFKLAQLHEVSLLMVGNGAQEVELRRNYPDANIYFAPFQNQTLMPRVYMAGDVFVLPSYGNEETWGLAVNEAMCTGRPIIVSDHVGCARDLVHHGKNGLKFAAGNVPALAGALREAFADGQRLKNWGEKSRTMIQNYSYATATRGLEEALEFVFRKDAVASAA